MKGATLFLKAASKLGIKNIFGIVGGEAQAIQFDEEKNINFFLTRHEFTAGIMADVYGRITGEPQICYSTFGPGLTNLSTGVCSAILDRSPMLAVSAQIPRSEVRFNQTHQCIDNVSFMRSLTKYSAEIDNIHDIIVKLTTALQIAIDGIPGPVYLSFPFDVMREEISNDEANQLLGTLIPPIKKSAVQPDFNKLQNIIQKLKSASHPIVVLGNQVIRENCTQEIIEFIEKNNIPVICSLAAKGIVPDDHPMFITTCNKYIDKIYQEPLTAKLFSECDLVLLIGYDFGEDLKPSLWDSKIPTVVINSFYDDMGSVFQPHLLYVGNMRESLRYLIAGSISTKEISPDVKQVKKVLDKRIAYTENKHSIAISSVISTIREVIGKDGILCSDIGLHKQYAGLLSKTYLPDTFLCSNVCGSFGFGLPAGLGAKLAKSDARVAVICGDGGFHSGSQDLETAVRYNIPIVVIVLKDNAFGLIKYYQLLEREETFNPSVEFGDVDFVKLANANGMLAKQINDIDDLANSMNKAYLSGKPFLIEIPIDYKYNL